MFMVSILIFSFGWVIYRLPLLRARNDLDSWMSREAAFLINNWILLFCAFFILFVTMFPTLSEAVTGNRISVAEPFYNKWMAPIGLVLLFLTGIGPLLGWRKSTMSSMRTQLMWPIISCVVVGSASLAMGFRFWTTGLCFALCALVAGTIVQEFWRGTNVRRGATGSDFFTSLVGLVGRNKRRYGGYIVHVGVVLFFLGCAGQTYKQEVKLLLKPGEQTTLGQYTVRHDALSVSDDGQKQMVIASMTVFENGQEVDKVYPAKWFFKGRESEQPTTEVAIRRRPGEDLYIVLANFEVATQTASVQVVINPLVNWIWFGFGILALGTGITLLPERTYSFALAKMPAESVATTVALLLALVLSGATVSAQHVESPLKAPIVPRNDVERRLGQRLVCLCGSCGKEPVGVCACDYAANIKRQIAALVDEGKTEDQILQHFIAQYGSQELLGAPLDQGFNRLAWLFPYLAGAGGVVAIGFAAVKWSRRKESEPEAPLPADSALAERLDDELRNLD